ncbi:hypothetical protein C6558_23630 [Ensifer sp. NM-2]|uniref:hypothetical protein n=1 Tax=Ensifer sp. NM-2 TaxID=2109730 RepID=UPI000D11D90A|nr:hypothetical protein [Ensifer sp. NM-2]PSS62164.1 hypothetical protein C6558_23630 [Ensifer sp. NM-2]
MVPAQRQREQVARHGVGEARTSAGYHPLIAEPRLLTSEPSWTYGEEEPDYRLTATGVTMAWSLAAGGGASFGDALGSNEASAYWITDRYHTAFRPFSVAGPQITFALPDQFGAQLPGSLLPANHGSPKLAHIPEDDWKDTTQSFAPAIVCTSRISPRSGALAATRTGLISIVDDGNHQLILEASQSPLNMRQPRPPILARNDRARASSHETGPFNLSRNPSMILHGPRASRFGETALPVGLDRRPRSLHAMRLVLQSPRAGIATPDWDGEVVIAVDAIYGAIENPVWTVVSAAIVLATDRYEWAAVARILSAQSAVCSLTDFRGKAGGTGIVQSARDALRAAAPATSAVLEVTLSHERPEGPLLRQLRVDLLTAGQGLAAPGVEAPLFFRFDDPEYNDQLGGLAKLARKRSPATADVDFVFAADMADIRPDQRVELGLSLRPAMTGGDVTMKFEPGDGNRLSYNGALLELTVERQRSGAVKPAKLGGKTAIVNAEASNEWGTFYLTGTSEGDFHAMKLDCAQLRENEDSAEPALAPDDQLQLILRLARSDAQVVTLRFDVVSRPDMPANQSSFGILMLKPDGNSVPVHLFAPGPDAEIVELVDPLDLVEGVVRRRAIFQWRSFHRAVELETASANLNPARFALQKGSGRGGTWLPSEVEDGWQATPG